jgi:fimbrial chaperone protein
VTVSNREGDAPVTLSIKPFAWSQNAQGEDVITPTADIVVFPKIVTIKKGEERVVRLAVADGKPDPGKAYRVYFEEQPEIGLKPESYKVRVYAKAGISVFYVPPKTEEQLVIEHIDTMQDKVVVKLVNKGAGFSKPQKVAILCRSANNIAAFRHEIDSWYLLAGASRSYSFPLPQDVQGRIQQVDVTVTTEEKTISGSAHVSSQPTTSQ